MAEGAPLLREYRVKSLIEGSNPSLSARYAKRPARGVLRIWRREVVDERSGYSAQPVPRPSGHRLRRCSLRHPASAVDKIVWNTTDSRRLAPQRAARRGEAHGWAEQSPAVSMKPRCLSKRRFAYLAERGICLDGTPSAYTTPPMALPFTIPHAMITPCSPRCPP